MLFDKNSLFKILAGGTPLAFALELYVDLVEYPDNISASILAKFNTSSIQNDTIWVEMSLRFCVKLSKSSLDFPCL